MTLKNQKDANNQIRWVMSRFPDCTSLSGVYRGPLKLVLTRSKSILLSQSRRFSTYKSCIKHSYITFFNAIHFFPYNRYKYIHLSSRFHWIVFIWDHFFPWQSLLPPSIWFPDVTYRETSLGSGSLRDQSSSRTSQWMKHTSISTLGWTSLSFRMPFTPASKPWELATWWQKCWWENGKLCYVLLVGKWWVVVCFVGGKMISFGMLNDMIMLINCIIIYMYMTQIYW